LEKWADPQILKQMRDVFSHMMRLMLDGVCWLL